MNHFKKSVSLSFLIFTLIGQFSFAATKLGSLSKFKNIAAEASTLVKKGDLVAAKAKMKDLETTWDEAEAGIKHRAAQDWRLLDKGIDRALDAIRSNPPSKEECGKAMADLLDIFDKLEK